MAAALALTFAAAPAGAQRTAAPAQKVDQEYTAKIKEYLQDPRITTELVDHLPASSTVPTPLKFPCGHPKKAPLHEAPWYAYTILRTGRDVKTRTVFTRSTCAVLSGF